tara:strand:+ start:404 stop:1021 length:618 start_codon:yes stop_codon:yes gene_type:complete
MRYFIALFALMIILFIGQFTENKFSSVLNILLVVLCYITFLLWEFNTLKKEYVADFKIKSQGKRIDVFNLLYTIFMTLLLWPWEGDKDIIYLISLFWVNAIVDIIMWFVYRKLKPNTIYIKDNRLILKNRWAKVRDLDELVQIKFNRFTKNLILHFRTKSEVSVKTKDYKSEDIEKLFEILIEKSEYDVSLPNNFKLKLKKITEN